MAVAVARRYFSATHFLSLPLYCPRSKSLLENFAHRVRNDEYADGIPRRAFRLPNTYHINVGDLRLEASHDVKAASKLLHSLDIRRILKHAVPCTATVKANDALNEEDDVKKTRVVFGTRPASPDLTHWTSRDQVG